MADKSYQKRGYVYVLSNPSMPGIVKIGRSKAGGKHRASQLYTTGVPMPFLLEFEMLVTDPEFVEVAAHEHLEQRRVNGSREFFACETDEAIHAVIGAYAFLMDCELVSLDMVWEPESLRLLTARLREDWGIDTHPVPLFSAIERQMTPEIAAALYQRQQESIRRRKEKRENEHHIRQEDATIQ